MDSLKNRGCEQGLLGLWCSRRWWIALLVVGVVTVAVIMLVPARRPSQPPPSLPPRVATALTWADGENQKAITSQIATLNDFFAEARKRTPGFSREILGWSSKWRLVVDKVPYTRGDRHAEYLKNTFDQRLFSASDLNQVIDQAVKNYGASVSGIENEMLVRLRADVRDLPRAALPLFENEASLRKAFDAAMSQAAARIGADLKLDISREALSAIAGEVLSMVAVRLGISAGILGTGASGSWATTGISLAVCLIVDRIVSWVWDWWHDPVGDLTAKINNKLEEIHRLIVDGDGKTPGLRAKLGELSTRRAALRRAAVSELLQPAEGKKP